MTLSADANMRRDILSGYAASAARLTSWVLVSAIVYRDMGFAAFGTLALIRALVGILNYTSLGLAPAMIHYLAKALQAPRPAIPIEPLDSKVLSYASPATNIRRQPTLLQQYYANGNALTFLLAFASFVLLIIAGPWLGTWLKFPKGMRLESTAIIVLMGAGMLLRLASEASSAFLQVTGRITLDNLMLAGSELLWVLLCARWVSRQTGDLVSVAGAFALAGLALLAVRFVTAQTLARVWFTVVPTSWVVLWQLLSYGLLVSLAQAADYLYAPVDYVLINKLISPLAVGTYAPAVQIDAALLLTVGAIAAVLLPKSATAFAAGRTDVLRRYYVRGTLASAGILLAAGLIVWAASPWILRLWLGDDLPATRAILPLVLIHTIVGGSSAVGRSILLGIGKVKPFTVAVLIAGVSNVVLSFVFVKYFDLGLRGIILGTIIVVIARCAIWMPWYVMRQLRRDLP